MNGCIYALKHPFDRAELQCLCGKWDDLVIEIFIGLLFWRLQIC